jgi:propanol-preferring alcohol dehydrogenase
MRALRLVDTHTFEIVDVPTPEPGPGEVLVRVGGAGLCHSDLHLLHNPRPVTRPFTIGHETAGWVAARGVGVTGVDDGEAVMVHGTWGCGHCKPCVAGLEQYCRNTMGAEGSGLFRDGGMAEYLLVPAARHLAPLGDLDPSVAAPLDDAALTPYSTIKASAAQLVADATAVVIGVGGLGHMAVQILRVITACRVIAIDTDPSKLALAVELGADVALPAGPDAAAAVMEVTGGEGAAAVFDFVGTDATLALAASVVTRGSKIVVVGVGGGTLPFSFTSMPYNCPVQSTFWGSMAELREVLALAAAGRIAVMTEQVPLDYAIDTYDRLQNGTLGAARAVAVP